MSARRSVLVLVLLSAALPAGAQEPLPRIKSADFPSVSRRAVFFEERINAADADIRKWVLMEVGYFFDVPDPEYTTFLRRMMRDPDPIVRGRAILKLHEMFVAIDVKELPRLFTGYHDTQVIDLGDAKTIPRLLEECQGRSGDAGYAAYALGLLRHKAAIPDLRKLARDQDNIFVRYIAARALFNCGDSAGARPILEQICRSQLDKYAAAPGQKGAVEGREPYYAAATCRALAEFGPEDRKVATQNLIDLTMYMQHSSVVNDAAHLPAVRQVLAAVTGRYFLSEGEARTWYRQKYGK